MIEQTKNHLVLLCDAFAGHKNISHWRVSYLAKGNGQFFKRLREGASCTLRTASEVTQWFSDNWPVDLEWPEGIHRPTPSGTEDAA